jgi:DNA-binding phage protein
VSTVTKYLNLIEAAPQERKPRTTITPEMIEEINSKYAICKNMSQVARELGIASTTVKKYLTEDNLKLMDKINDDRDALFFYIYHLFGQYGPDEPLNPWNITQM